jgi:hypothetical protein
VTDLADIRERLGRMEAKLDLLVPLEPRVRRLEHWQAWLAGAGTIIGGMITWFVKPHIGG